MKKTYIRISSILVILLVLLSACGKKEKIVDESNHQYLENLTYSNIVDKETKSLLAGELEKAGVDRKNLDTFFEKVDDYNKAIGEENLNQEGFKTVTPGKNMEIEYDYQKIDQNWEKKYPLFIGNNCRITSYDLLKDSIELDKNKKVGDQNLFMDIDALESDENQTYSQDDIEAFKILYGQVPTEKTKDISTHVDSFQKAWKDRGIRFINDKVKMINVIFHSDLDEDILFIGHSGILVGDKDLYFIEKVSFDSPYQVLKFKNKIELNDYLMGKYDISYEQETAKPFIMENDQLLKEYRSNPNNKEY